MVYKLGQYLLIITIEQISLLCVVNELKDNEVMLIFDYLCHMYLFILLNIFYCYADIKSWILLTDVYNIIFIIFVVSLII